jgi:hypothetical protein
VARRDPSERQRGLPVLRIVTEARGASDSKVFASEYVRFWGAALGKTQPIMPAGTAITPSAIDEIPRFSVSVRLLHHLRSRPSMM